MLDFHWLYNNREIVLEKPKGLEKMLEYGRIGEDFKHARIDFYINNKIYFGEITFCHLVVCKRFIREYSIRLGDLIKI